MKHLSIIFSALMAAAPVFADVPTVVEVKVENTGMGWNFDVTLEHPDTGWDHYADGWEIVGADGTVFGTRTLHHPHVNEQPFTRSLRNVMLPDGMSEVFIRVKCSDVGWHDSDYKVSLKR